MSHFGDSRRGRGGPGILPLQHHSFEADGLEMDDRGCILAMRVVGREEKTQRPIYGQGTVGDLIGGTIWPADTRETGAWSFAMPVRIRSIGGGVRGPVTDSPSAGPAGPAGELSGRPYRPIPGRVNADPHVATVETRVPFAPTLTSRSPLVPTIRPQTMIPMRGSEWEEDVRFVELLASRMPGHPEYPRDYSGIMLAATDEDRQVEQFHPTDPRLVAPAAGTDIRNGAMGTPVVDVRDDGRIDPDRSSPLQSLIRVCKMPTGAIGELARNTVLRRNWLSLNIGAAGLGDIGGALWNDYDPDIQASWQDVGGGLRTGGIAPADARRRIFALPGTSQGGPFDVGAVGDAHRVGIDADGNPINHLHLSTGALFRKRRDVVRDGPLDFEDPFYPRVKDNGVPSRVRRRFDRARGVWSEFVRDFWVVPEETTDPPFDGDPPGQGEPPPEGPITPPPIVKEGGDHIGAWGGAATWVEASFPSVAFAPQMQIEGEQDFRHWSSPSLEDVQARMRTTPITMRLEAFGAQYGPAGGPHLTEAAQWRYASQPGSCRWPGGLAAGGAVLLPPEVDMSDIDDDFAPPGVTPSTVTLIAGPGARFGVGLPELSAGGLKNGVAIDRDTSDSDLIFRRYGSTGAAGDTLKLLHLAEMKTKTGSDFTPGSELKDVAAAPSQLQLGFRIDTNELQINNGGTIVKVTMSP